MPDFLFAKLEIYSIVILCHRQYRNRNFKRQCRLGECPDGTGCNHEYRK